MQSHHIPQESGGFGYEAQIGDANSLWDLASPSAATAKRWSADLLPGDPGDLRSRRRCCYLEHRGLGAGLAREVSSVESRGER
jgi:hypothetical protein